MCGRCFGVTRVCFLWRWLKSSFSGCTSQPVPLQPTEKHHIMITSSLRIRSKERTRASPLCWPPICLCRGCQRRHLCFHSTTTEKEKHMNKTHQQHVRRCIMWLEKNKTDMRCHLSWHLGGASELVVLPPTARSGARTRSGPRTGPGTWAAVTAVLPLILHTGEGGGGICFILLREKADSHPTEHTHTHTYWLWEASPLRRRPAVVVAIVCPLEEEKQQHGECARYRNKNNYPTAYCI